MCLRYSTKPLPININVFLWFGSSCDIYIYMFQAMQYLFNLSCEIPSGDSACIIGLENSQYDNMTFDWLCHPITRAESFARFSRDDIYKNYIL